MLSAMLYVDLFRDTDREGGFHRLNSTYPQWTTIDLAKGELAGKRFPWAKAFEVVNGEGDILAVGIKDA